MRLILTEDDFLKLKPTTRADILAKLIPTAANQPEPQSDDYYWDDVVDLSQSEVETLMAGLSAVTIAGLRVIAEHGPAIQISLLSSAGITNCARFQGAVTKRTRTVTGEPNSYLLATGIGTAAEDGDYAVTETTFRSLRAYFQMEKLPPSAS